MAQEGLSMRKVREVLRLRFGSRLSARQVAHSCGIARSTVGEYVRRAEAAGLGWPLPEAMDDAALEVALFVAAAPPRGGAGRGMPNPAYLKQELSKKHVTLALLHDEYRKDRPDGYGYTQFCEHARRGLRRLGLVMRQEHRAGEKLFVDWAGDKIRIVQADTGEVAYASLFVAVLGCSSYTFAEAMADETSPNWIRAHVHAYEFIGGVTEVTVPDNTRTAVRRPDYYEPDLNPLYQDCAAHYGTAVIPARVRHPKDKGAVEAGVLLAERWLLAALRNRTFFSLEELNAAIRELLPRINDRIRRVLRASRRQLYETLDRPALRPLPQERYQWVEWKTATVGPDYHVECDRHYYSVPSALVGARVDVRLSLAAVEVLHKHKRVASHLRSYLVGKHTTCKEHMPSSHRHYAEWTPDRITAWAMETGPATAAIAAEIMRRRPHPEQGFRSCMGLISLGRKHTPQRLEAGCRRALEIGSASYQTVKSLLAAGLDRAPAIPDPLPPDQPDHANVRGSAYFEGVQ